jgi:DinB superfamily
MSALSRQEVHTEMQHAQETFHALLSRASPADLRRVSRGTRWTNEQLLFHMLFGYLIVRALLVLVKLVPRLPDRVDRGFARLLNSASTPFNAVNYWGSCAGAKVFGHQRMGRKFDQVIASLHRHLDAETDTALARGMRFPTRWDPFFTDVMTLADVYHYATQHFDFHRRQLTLDPSD